MEIGRRDHVSLMTSSSTSSTEGAASFQIDDEPCDLLSATSGHGSGSPPFVKKKHHRRARKGRRRNQSGRGMSSDDPQDKTPPPLSPPVEETPSAVIAPAGDDNTAEASPPKKQKFNARTATTLARKRHQVYLRPTNGPLLNAPRNSTQFIIDDHENSNLFFNFENGSGHHNNHVHPSPPLPSAVVAAEAAAAAAVAVAAAAAAAAGGGNPDDDDNAWAEYSERDFQSVYETAHQEEIAEWDRKKLCDEISALERRQRELVNILARLDPEVYLQKLQSELLSLQEVNRVLKEEQSELNPALPDSSTAEDSAVYVEEEDEEEEEERGGGDGGGGGAAIVDIVGGGDSQQQQPPQPPQHEGEG